MAEYFTKLFLPCQIPEKDIQIFAETLEECVLAIITDQPDGLTPSQWRIMWMTQHPPDIEEWVSILNDHLAMHPLGPVREVTSWQLTFEQIADINWLQKTIEDFAPFSLARFFIQGSHSSQALSCPKGQIPLVINATTAFGTGQHPTTEGCLRALDLISREKSPPFKILDMGTGTGILAIASAKLWPESDILAIDIDEDSIKVCEQHAHMNKVENVKIQKGEGFHARVFEKIPQGHYDLILANILASPLKEMAPDLAGYLAKGGQAILSGLLTEQALSVAKAYQNHNLKKTQDFELREWTTLVMQK